MAGLPEIPEKIVVSFKPVGSAPILRQQKFRVNSRQNFATLLDFLRKQLHMAPADSLLLYVNNTFAPALSEQVGNVYGCFAVDSALIVNYSTTSAYG